MPESSNELRLLELLWRDADGTSSTTSRRGPRPARDVGEVVTTAVRIADTEGMPALTVRRLAAELGVPRMSVYTYVAGLDQLTELMVDVVAAECVQPRSRQGWRNQVRRIAATNLACYERHAWLIDLPVHRPTLGPGVTAKYDSELRALASTGLGDLELDLVLRQLVNVVRSAAGDLVAADRIERVTGQSDEQWWSAYADLLGRYVTAAEFPLAVRVGAAAGQAQGSAYDARSSYDFGLSLLIAGIEALVLSR